MANDIVLLKVATLTTMRKQLESIIDDFERPTTMSIGQFQKLQRDMGAQLEALKFAETELKRIYGTPPEVIEGNPQ